MATDAPPLRPPTDDELHQMAEQISAGMGGLELPDALAYLGEARACVFDEYMSDGPGYIGRVCVVVWPGGPDLVSVFTFKAGKAKQEV